MIMPLTPITHPAHSSEAECITRQLGSVLIRHGESEGNIGLPTDSPAAIRLTERGHAQADDLVQKVIDCPDLIVVSPYLRTQQTAAPLIRQLHQVPVETWEVHEFCYLNPLRYAGTTEAERGVFARSYWEQMDPHHRDGGGAESFADLISRVDEMLRCLRATPERWTLVFSHAHFIKAVELRLDDPEAPVDQTLMQSYSQRRQESLLRNCQWLLLDL